MMYKKDNLGGLQKDTYQREFESSPTYRFSNSGNVTTTSPLVVDIVTAYPTAAKYMPLDEIEVINNSAVGIWLYPNQNSSSKILIPAGVIRRISKDTIPAWNSALLYTTTGTAAAGEIEVNIWKGAIKQDDIARINHKKRFFSSTRW